VYLEYFGLAERPFSIAPDPQYLYMSARHKEAMAHLTYGLSQGGCFIVLTGEVGTGKTTLCRNLLEGLPQSVEVALILNANINELELLQTICDELKIAYRNHDSQKQLLDQINAHLLSGFARNQQTVLIIDEAQLLSRNVLEQVRLLTNLETTKSKLLQIILIGQPELNDLLSRNDLRQLAQRVTARYHLGPLERSEIEDYINFRLRVAGCGKPLFSRQALGQLHKSTEGIPRRINVLADHALLSAYSNTSLLVDAKCVKLATEEVFIKTNSPSFLVSKKTAFMSIGIALLVLNFIFWWMFLREDAFENAIVSSPAIDVPAKTVMNTSDAEVGVDLEEGGEKQLTTIITPGAVTPGSVVIADEPLDELDVLVSQSNANATTEPLAVNTVVVNEVPLSDGSTFAGELSIKPPAARVFDYDSYSKLGLALDASADLTSRTAAFRALGAAWDVDLPAQMIQPACDLLRAEGVKCLGVSSWEQLERYNRPAILVLDQNSSAHRVIVFKLDQNNAQVLVGQSVLDVSVEELRSRWTNNGITFWRPSAAGSEPS